MTITEIHGSGFGGALARIRKSRQLPQSRLARQAGLSASYICRVEFGERAPTLDTVLMLAAALECTDAERDTLLMAAGYLPRGSGMDADLLQINEALHDAALPEAYRDALRQSVAALRATVAVWVAGRQAA